MMLDPNILKKIKPVTAMFSIGQYLLQKEFKEVRREIEFMDLLGFNPGGDSCEIEIKTSDYDLLKEMQKDSKIAKHTNYIAGIGYVPTRFYFLTQKPVLKSALTFMDKHKLPYGLIIYDSNTGHWGMVRKSARLSEAPFTGELNRYEGRDYTHAN